MTEKVKVTPRFRMLLAGKTGVGKSSFCNYLLGQELFKTGKGVPVTQWEENFKEEVVPLGSFELGFIDTVGIEPDNYSTWLQRLKEYGDKERKARHSNDWVHGTFYLINASAGRVENIDIEAIRCLKSQFRSSPVQVILTHCDHANEAQLAAIEDEVSSVGGPC